MDIVITESKLRFRNPNVGQATRAIEDHYNGRRVTAIVEGDERLFRFAANELAFDADEEDIEQAIAARVQAEQD